MARCLCIAVVYKVIGHPLMGLQWGACGAAALSGLVSAKALTLGYRLSQDIAILQRWVESVGLCYMATGMMRAGVITSLRSVACLKHVLTLSTSTVQMHWIGLTCTGVLPCAFTWMAMVGFSAPSSVLSTPSSIVFIHGWYFQICTHKRIMCLLQL